MVSKETKRNSTHAEAALFETPISKWPRTCSHPKSPRIPLASQCEVDFCLSRGSRETAPVTLRGCRLRHSKPSDEILGVKHVFFSVSSKCSHAGLIGEHVLKIYTR